MSYLDKEPVNQIKKQMEASIRNTILNVEKVFFKLETQNGTPISEKFKQDFEKSAELCEKEGEPLSFSPSPKNSPKKSQKKGKAEEGIEIDLQVKVKKGDGNRLLNMAIECPQYHPKRIQFEGKWLNIV